jgi:hypothetical protein
VEGIAVGARTNDVACWRVKGEKGRKPLTEEGRQR